MNGIVERMLDILYPPHCPFCDEIVPARGKEKGTAEKMFPGTVEYMIPSHTSKEPAACKMMEELKLSPMIDGNLSLGEGTGAVLLFPMLDMALRVYHGNTTFADIQVEQYERYGV